MYVLLNFAVLQANSQHLQQMASQQLQQMGSMHLQSLGSQQLPSMATSQMPQNNSGVSQVSPACPSPAPQKADCNLLSHAATHLGNKIRI